MLPWSQKAQQGLLFGGFPLWDISDVQAPWFWAWCMSKVIPSGSLQPPHWSLCFSALIPLASICWRASWKNCSPLIDCFFHLRTFYLLIYYWSLWERISSYFLPVIPCSHLPQSHTFGLSSHRFPFSGPGPPKKKPTWRSVGQWWPSTVTHISRMPCAQHLFTPKYTSRSWGIIKVRQGS